MSQTLRIISIRSLKFITGGILFINQYYTKENTYVRLADRAMASICVFSFCVFSFDSYPDVYIAWRCICPPRVCCLRIHLGEENCPDLSSSKNKYGRHRAKYPLSCLTSIEHVNFIFRARCVTKLSSFLLRSPPRLGRTLRHAVTSALLYLRK